MTGSGFHEGINLITIAREIRACTRCALHINRQNAVPGEGAELARMMLVGEAPGREEDIQGRPFVGRSGKVLNEILDKAGLQRGRLFITSVVKCRPPGNRVPRKEEYQICIRAHLQRQISVVQPSFICLMGAVATKALLGADRLFTIRGRIIRHEEKLLFPTYHPAAAGRSRNWYRSLASDMKTLHALVKSRT